MAFFILFFFFFYFFFNDTATTEIYTLSLHDALPISYCNHKATYFASYLTGGDCVPDDQNSLDRKSGSAGMPRPISYAVFCLKKKKNKNKTKSQQQASSHSRSLDIELCIFHFSNTRHL